MINALTKDQLEKMEHVAQKIYINNLLIALHKSQVKVWKQDNTDNENYDKIDAYQSMIKSMESMSKDWENIWFEISGKKWRPEYGAEIINECNSMQSYVRQLKNQIQENELELKGNFSPSTG